MSDWQPMSRERFRQLRRGERLRDRRGRVWSVVAEPHQRNGLDHVVIRSGDLVNTINERWADDYQLLPRAAEEATPLPAGGLGSPLTNWSREAELGL